MESAKAEGEQSDGTTELSINVEDICKWYFIYAYK